MLVKMSAICKGISKGKVGKCRREIELRLIKTFPKDETCDGRWESMYYRLVKGWSKAKIGYGAGYVRDNWYVVGIA